MARALARQVRRDLDARLGADRRRRRERLHGGRSAASRRDLRRHGHALRPRDEHAACRARLRRSRRSRRAPTGRSRSCSRRPIRRRSTTPISSSSRPPTARRRGRRSAPTSRVPMPGIPATLDATAAAQVDRNGKRGVVYTIAPSPLVAPLIWVGTDDGLIHVTRDDGASWQNVTPPAITPWSRVTMIEASHFDANTAYASVDRHQLQDFEPYIYRTRDRGQDLAADHDRPAGGRLRARREGGPDAARAAVRRHRARRLRLVRRRRHAGSRCSSTCR